MALQRNINLSIIKVLEELKNKPEDPKLYYKLGNLYKRKGETDKSIEQYQKALSIQPTFVRALNSLAIASAMKGRYNKSLFFLKKSIECEPDSADAYYYIASIYARRKEEKKSIEWLNQAVQRGYNNWDRIKTDSNLENIRSSSEYEMLIKDH